VVVGEVIIVTDTEALKFLKIVYASEEQPRQDQLISAWLVVRKIPTLGGVHCFSRWARRVCWNIAMELVGAGTGRYEDQRKHLSTVFIVLQDLVGEDMFKTTIDFSYLRGWSGRAAQVHLASRSIFMTSNNEPLLRIRVSGRDSLLRWQKRIGFPDKERMVRLAAIIGEAK
jgi:hypothetical protein